MKNRFALLFLLLGIAGIPSIFAAESPAEAVQAVLAGFSNGDVTPLISRLSDIDRKEFSGLSSSPGLQFIKDNLNLPPETTKNWGEYEYGIANDYIRNMGVVKTKKDAALAKAYRDAFIKDQWVQGNYSEVDLVFPLNTFKYSPGLIRFVLYKEAGTWKISHFGSVFMTAAMAVPMGGANPFIIGDYADFCFSYIYGETFASIQFGSPTLKRLSISRQLKNAYSATAAKAAEYIASGGTASLGKGRRKELIYDEKGKPVGEMKYDFSHKRSEKNPYFARPPKIQLAMLRNPFMASWLAYEHFATNIKADTTLAARAMALSGEAYANAGHYEKAAEAYEAAALGPDTGEQLKAKKALAAIYMNQLRQPKKAEQHLRDLETAGQIPDYDKLEVSPPETLIIRTEPEMKRIAGFELGADKETVYLLYHESHHKDSPPWVESTVVEYRINGSSRVISSEKNEHDRGDSSFFYIGKGDDGLWIYGVEGAGYKINYSGELLKYFSDVAHNLDYSPNPTKPHKASNVSIRGLLSADGLVYTMGDFRDYRGMKETAFSGIRIFNETTGKGKAGIIEEKKYYMCDIRKRAEKVSVASADIEEILVYDMKNLKRKYLKGEPPSSSLTAAENLSSDHEGNLYVSLSDRKVFIFSKDGKKLREFDTGDILPLHISVDGGKNIYLAGPVGDGKTAGIRAFSNTGAKLGSFDFETPEQGDGRFFVRNLQVTDKGTIYVNIGNSEIRRYNIRGKELDRWKNKFRGNIQLAPDNVRDSLYIFAARDTFHYNGAATEKLPTTHMSYTYMAQMSGDSKGLVHGLDFNSGVFLLDPQNGKPEFKSANAKNMSLASNKMAVDTSDNLWALSGPILRKLSPEGKELVNIKVNGRKIRGPISIDYDAWGNFIVADRNNNRLIRYNKKGETISDIDVSKFTDGIDKIRVDKHNNLYLFRGDLWGGRKEVLFRFNGLFSQEN